MTTFRSVFDEVFDVVVLGGGFVGLAAARSARAVGNRVLLVEASGDLLWEATRALETTVITSEGASEGWRRWLRGLEERQAADGQVFDAAGAEVLMAYELAAEEAPFRTLLYAAPVAVERGDDGLMTSVIVATKSGARRVAGRRWIDASEGGQLAKLARPGLVGRGAREVFRSLILQSPGAEALDPFLGDLAQREPGLEIFANSLRPGERRLRWRADGPWHQRATALVGALREMVAGSAVFAVSHCAMADFPVYRVEDELQPPAGLPANLLVLSPALTTVALATPGDRFALGESAGSRLDALPPSRPVARPPARLPEPVAELAGYDVVVAGTGTAGAAAAVSAGRQGARTLALDQAGFPGGVGTGGMICGYFHGAAGGLQEEFDALSKAMTELVTGEPGSLRGWHHDAKKIALLMLFERAGVDFQGNVLLAGVEDNGAGRVEAALVVKDGQLLRVPAQAFIDSTGDADLAAFAGAQAISGRPGDSRTLSYSQSVLHLRKGEKPWLAQGCNFDAGWVDPTDPDDLTRARLRGIAQHLRAEWTAADRPLTIAPILGLRQSRQIETDVQITLADLTGGRVFEDSIGRTETVADTHSVDFEFETDEMAFYYWTCRGFRTPLRCELPYRMLLPRGLENVWVACRAAGISVEAAYGLRMQRDMQRLGEAAGIAAAMAAETGKAARSIDLPGLRAALEKSGAREAKAQAAAEAPELENLLAELDKGLPGFHLWQLYQAGDACRDAVLSRLRSGEPRSSFYAAALVAMSNGPEAEPRLLEALAAREVGVAPEERTVWGAFGQCIDLPFWLQAVLLLRRIGSEACLEPLRALAAEPGLPLNVRTILALTLEQLALRLGSRPEIAQVLEALLATKIPDPVLPPSRSLWHTLAGQPQKRLHNSREARVEQDHTWQLHLVIARTRKILGLAPLAEAGAFRQDARALVRRAFP